jgi:hypothetical protein
MILKFNGLIGLVISMGLYQSTIAQPNMPIPSNQKSFAFRLKPHDDLKKGILAYASEHRIKAGGIVTAVGSLEYVNLRFANQQIASGQSGHFEIVSLVGTFSETYAHLHLSVSDSLGRTIGGHLLEGNMVYTTAEIVITQLTDVEFTRQKDKTYGYDELIIIPSRK